MKKHDCESLNTNRKRLIGRLAAAWHIFKYHRLTNHLEHVQGLISFILLGKSTKHGVCYKYHHLWFLPENPEIHNLDEIFWFGLYDFPLTETISTIVDIGAHIGDSAIFFNDHWPKAKIYSYEPNPDSCEVYQKNINHNIRKKKNINIYPEAVVGSNQRNKKIKLFIEAKATSRSTTRLDYVISDSDLRVINASSISFDAVIKRAGGKIDLLKIDAEGAEFELIPEIIKHHSQVHNLAIELHYRKKMPNPNILYTIISKLSKHYSILLLPPQYLSTPKSQLAETFAGGLPDNYSLMLYAKQLN